MLSQEPLSLGELARRELLADSERPDSLVAGLIGGSRGTVSRARQRLEAAGLVPVRPGSRSPVPLIPALPPMPEALSSGLCVRHPEPGRWTSTKHAERAAAAQVCGSCPVRRECLEWSLSLPHTDTAVWAGLGPAGRDRLRAEHERQAG